MKTLNEIYQNYQSPDGHGDKGTAHTYIDEYERLLEPYRKNSIVLEIGLCEGESLRMWEEYFIDSKVIGVDITSKYLSELIKERTHHIIIADATRESIINKIDEKTFDVLIDDGSHRLVDQLKTFFIFKNKINPGGIYIIEDIEDLDNVKNIFLALHNNVEIIDNRHIKDRDDDVLIVYKF
jgi:23S rRNA U2552 (ribose-2'-O)-methylase RlmE/FtsJ